MKLCSGLFLITTAIFLAAATSGHALPAGTIMTTDPVGFVGITCPAGSDTVVSPPMTRTPEYSGTLSALVSGSTLTMIESPKWTPDRWVYAKGTQAKTYYAQIGGSINGSPREGAIYKITSNDASSITLDLNGDNISSIQAKTVVSIIPYWTIGTLFPASAVNISFVPSPSVSVRQTQLFIPNCSGSGANLAPSTAYFYYGGTWRQMGRPLTENHDDDLVIPNSYFILRNPATVASATTLTLQGHVQTGIQLIPLATQSGAVQDNSVSVSRPADVSLNKSGLIAGGAFTPSVSESQRKDQLLVFDNSQTAINKSPSAVYFFCNGAWRKVGQPITGDFGNDMIPAGAGVIIRKAASDGATKFWRNAPNYSSEAFEKSAGS